jgi:membrane associated rhomboid family serine protease
MSVTIVLVIFTCFVSFAAFNNIDLMQKLKHYPYSEVRNKDYYRMLTSGFVHNDPVHLAINMFVFWQFGSAVESKFQEEFGPNLGLLLFFVMYLSSIVFSDIPSLIKQKNNPAYAAVGASGAVSAVLFTFILFNPWAQLSLYMIIPFRAIVGGVLYLAYEQWASRNAQDNIGHDAHFTGAIYGIIFTLLLSPNAYTDFVDHLIYNSPYW